MGQHGEDIGKTLQQFSRQSGHRTYTGNLPIYRFPGPSISGDVMSMAGAQGSACFTSSSNQSDINAL